MMRDLTGDHRGYSYIYDDENRLVAIRKSGGTLSVATFEYDALGRRIETVDAIAGTTTRYYYDDQRVLLETDATGTETDIRCFVYGNYIDEVLLMVDLAGGNGVTDGDYYYGHDHLYSVYALFDAGRQVAERYYYDAYGKTRIYNSDYSASQATSQYGNPTTFTGRRLDRLDWDGSSEYQLSLMYYRARAYDPQTGRFMQRDPLGIDPSEDFGNSYNPEGQYRDGVNVYQYVKSEPVKYFDPFGLHGFPYPIGVDINVGECIRREEERHKRKMHCCWVWKLIERNDNSFVECGERPTGTCINPSYLHITICDNISMTKNGKTLDSKCMTVAAKGKYSYIDYSFWADTHMEHYRCNMRGEWEKYRPDNFHYEHRKIGERIEKYKSVQQWSCYAEADII